MKLCLCIFFVLLGFSQLVVADLKKDPVSKLVFLSASPISYGYMLRMKQNIIADCKENGHNIEKDLEKTYTDLIKCVNKTGLYVDKREEYLNNLESCTAEPIKKVKTCLKKEHEYYPDILLDIAKAQINFICDHFDNIQNELIPCVKVFEKQDVRSGYDKCFVDIVGALKDVSAIPSSLDQFCQKYSPSHSCFVELLNKQCTTQYPKLKQFGEDYNIAMNVPCNKNTTKSIFV